MDTFFVGMIWEHIGLYLIGVVLWSLIVAAGIYFIWGFWKKSWKAFVFSGFSILIPSVVLSTQKGWFGMFLLLPLLAFGLGYYTKKRMHISI